MKLIFYGGVNEIGGNKILLEDKDAKIFLDFGMSFGQGCGILFYTMTFGFLAYLATLFKKPKEKMEEH